MKIKLFGQTLFIGFIKPRWEQPKKFESDAQNASPMWWDAFTDGGGIASECRCGRFHFADRREAGDWDTGELERYQTLAAEKPDRYIPDGYNDSISVCGPLQLVWNCPCGESGKHEEYLLMFKEEILDYYKRLARKQQQEATQTASQLSGAVDPRQGATPMIIGGE